MRLKSCRWGTVSTVFTRTRDHLYITRATFVSGTDRRRAPTLRRQSARRRHRPGIARRATLHPSKGQTNTFVDCNPPLVNLQPWRFRSLSHHQIVSRQGASRLLRPRGYFFFSCWVVCRVSFQDTSAQRHPPRVMYGRSAQTQIRISATLKQTQTGSSATHLSTEQLTLRFHRYQIILQEMIFLPLSLSPLRVCGLLLTTQCRYKTNCTTIR